ncbi:Vacuolar protein-sorting-associated protein 27 [Modicella reniformis]|uniref:Vacuolar protein sorting-associated protein 27 n=1 Tax=Modicella reniformis TaxID=1440133 RepID=A0A9P6MAI7_9FUNG|nr:Vacuolar protein-sorting-associated protein 27 [Modicella reniformis]
MNWLRGASPVDELVDRATSENLPAGAEDLALNLEICDQIRSRQVLPKDAARALKRRISHNNPNVQLLALGLTDVCVKNGGQHFLVEMASREFIDNLTTILRTPAPSSEVKDKILALIQSWGRLFRGRQGLGYVCDTYMTLQHEGYEFPPEDNVGAALVETQAPPDWTDSDVCTRCRTTFTLTNRKHHCRACGSTYCGRCSSKNMSLPHLGINQEVRVCDGCWIKKKMGGQGTSVHDSFGPGGPPEIVNAPTLPTSTSTIGVPGVTTSTEDEDLKKAIELSLNEATSRPGYSAPSAHREAEPSRTTTAPRTEDDDDADLLAAIEASLRETNLNATPQPEQRQSAYATYTYTANQETITKSSDNLTATERENIKMFSSLVDRIQMMNGDVTGNQEVQVLYEQISRLQTKLATGIEEADKKQREAIQFNEKIDQAVKMYDHLLQERLQSAYQRRVSSNHHPGIQSHPEAPHVGYNVTSSPHTPHSSHAYQHLTGSDSRYNPYPPGTPYAQQSITPFAPQAPPPIYQSQASQPPASAPFATAPFISAAPPIQVQAQVTAPPMQPMAVQTGYQSSQDPFYSSASVLPPGTQAPGHYPQVYQGMAAQPQSTTGVVSYTGQAPYAPYGSQTPYAPVAPVAPAAPVVPVEEKPLIEL